MVSFVQPTHGLTSFLSKLILLIIKSWLLIILVIIWLKCRQKYSWIKIIKVNHSITKYFKLSSFNLEKAHTEQKTNQLYNQFYCLPPSLKGYKMVGWVSKKHDEAILGWVGCRQTGWQAARSWWRRWKLAPAQAKGQPSGSGGLIFTDWHEDDETDPYQAKDHHIILYWDLIYIERCYLFFFYQRLVRFSSKKSHLYLITEHQTSKTLVSCDKSFLW